MARRARGSTNLGREAVGRAALTAEKRRLIAMAARAELCRRSLSHFVRYAIAAGVVHGIRRVQWGWHLEEFCRVTQLQLEGWIVANGPARKSGAWTVWAARHAHMIERQREAWERTGATWEDGEPEPWLRYVLVQNELDNLPPGTLKSTIAMVCANAWIWLWAPRFSFGAASGIDANVTRDSNATRDLVRSRWYRETFSIAWTASDDEPRPEDAAFEAEAQNLRIDPKKDAISDWKTTAGGQRYSRTIQRGFTGLHVDGIFIDDPDDADRVWNEAARVRPQNRYTRAIENRVNDEHRSIRKVMQQRVHSEDFSFYLLSIARWSPAMPKGWMWFCVPAEFGRQPADAPRETPWGPFDPRTTEGETIHPRLSPGVLADKREKMPDFEAQYNGNPDRRAAGILPRRFARFFVTPGELVDTLRKRPTDCPSRSEQPPVVIKLEQLSQLMLNVDAANSLDPRPDGKVSAVGLMVTGRRGDEIYVVDDHTKVLGISGTYRAIFRVLGMWPLDRVLVEKKALGPSVIAELEKAIRRGWYVDDETDERVPLLGPDGKRVRAVVEAFDPGKDSKATRANGVVPPWQQGTIFLRDGAPWLYPQVDANRKTVDEGAIGEICGFPASRRNDRMDCLSMAVAYYRNQPALSARDRWKVLGS